MIPALKQKPTSEEVVQFLAKEYTKAGSEERLAIPWIAVYNSLKDPDFFKALIKNSPKDFLSECKTVFKLLLLYEKDPSKKEIYRSMATMVI